jgi:hypothetical protein
MQIGPAAGPPANARNGSFSDTSGPMSAMGGKRTPAQSQNYAICAFQRLGSEGADLHSWRTGARCSFIIAVRQQEHGNQGRCDPAGHDQHC